MLSMDQIAEAQVLKLSKIISASLNRYCLVNKLDIKKVMESGELYKEIKGGTESFFHKGNEIFRLIQTYEEHGLAHYSFSWEMQELF